jgi:hypothetical protein
LGQPFLYQPLISFVYISSKEYETLIQNGLIRNGFVFQLC